MTMENNIITNLFNSPLQILSYFANSIYGKNTVNDIAWDIAKNCISQLNLDDCVIYLLDETNKHLIQKAAFGNKNPKDYEIYEPIIIPNGEGIVGMVAQTGIAEIIADTRKDKRYIVDDEVRLSEITVPIIYQDKVLGIIDSEHPEPNYFTPHHLAILTAISNLAANKIFCAITQEKLYEYQYHDKGKLVINSTLGVHFLPMKDIIRCEADDNYTYFFMTNSRTFCSSKTMKEYEIELLKHNFVRVHRSHFINPKFVSEIQHEGSIKMTDNSRIEVSRRRKKEVNLHFKQCF